jgi:hypothetical protein
MKEHEFQFSQSVDFLSIYIFPLTMCLTLNGLPGQIISAYKSGTTPKILVNQLLYILKI